MPTIIDETPVIMGTEKCNFKSILPAVLKRPIKTDKKAAIPPILNVVRVKINNKEYDFSEKIKMKYSSNYFHCICFFQEF